MPNRRTTTLLGLLTLVAPLAGVPAIAAEAPPPGVGSSELSVVAARITLPGGLDLRVVDTGAETRFDPDASDADRAYGEVTGVAVDAPSGPVAAFPDPPMASESRDGRREASEGEADVSVPPHKLRADLDDVVASVVRTINDVATRHRPTGVSEELDQGIIAEGAVRPAHLVTTVAADMASVEARSEIADLSVLGGVSRFGGVGPGDHRSWAGTDDAGATAQALKIASATILETGAVLSFFGIDTADIPDADLAAMAEALGVIPAIDEAVDRLGVPAPVTAGDLTELLDDHAGAVRALVVDEVIEAPLLAVADVRGSVAAVASIEPDGDVRTSSRSTGSVGTLSVGTTDVGDFDAEGSADGWNTVEAQVRTFLNTVLGSLGSEYEDTVMVRVMPRLVESTDLDGNTAVAQSSISLLEVVIDPPSSPPEAEPPSQPEPDDLLDDPIDVGDPDVGTPLVSVNGGAAGGGGATVLGAPDDDVVRLTVGDMEARAEHVRPGVEPRCVPTCDSATSLNRPWTPEEGFSAPDPGLNRPDGELPNTGGSSAGILAFAVTALALAAVLRAAPSWSRPVSRLSAIRQESR